MTVELHDFGLRGMALLDDGKVIARARHDLCTHCWRLSLFKCCWLDRDPGYEQLDLLRQHGLSARAASAVRILSSRDEVVNVLRDFVVSTD